MNLNFSDFITRMRRAEVSIKESEMFIMFCRHEAWQSVDYQQKSNLAILMFNLICDTAELGSSQWEKDMRTIVSLYPQTALLLGRKFVLQRALHNTEKVIELSETFSANIWEEIEQLEALENGDWQPNEAFFTPDNFDKEN